jgi:hypothetical protein
VIYASKGNLAEFLDLPLFEYLSNFLQDAITVAWNAPDPALRAHLEANVQHFSGFKTYQVQQEMTRKLFDVEGKIVDFVAFKREALAVNQLYNVDYLQAEYELAVAGAQMASKWAEFEPGALLQYRTVGDNLVRPEHVAYDNVTLPAGHSWWLSHYPPNGWRCRCDVVELGPDAERTPDHKLEALPNVPKMFARNVGKTGEVFGQEHPYFDVPAATAARIEDITKTTKGGQARGKK